MHTEASNEKPPPCSQPIISSRSTRRESTATRGLRELDALWLATTNDADTGQEVTLQSDVTTMTMRLWVNSGWRDTGLLKIFLQGAV